MTAARLNAVVWSPLRLSQCHPTEVPDERDDRQVDHAHERLPALGERVEGREEEGHQQERVVGDVDHRGPEQRPLRGAFHAVERIVGADERLVVADVVGDREAGSDGDEADPEHHQRRREAGEQYDRRRHDDEADVHDVGERYDRRLTALRLLHLRPVQQVRDHRDGDERDDECSPLIGVASHR
jgi:hypothetical protein